MNSLNLEPMGSVKVSGTPLRSRILVLCLVGCGMAAGLFPAGKAGAASLTSGADFLLMTTGARPDGMGQAFSAVGDDINTLSFNPAGLGNIRLPQVGYGHEVFLADISYDFLGAAIPLGDAGVLGLGYLGMGTTPFNSTNDPSAPSVSVQDTALIGAWGRSFYNFHLGFAVKYINETVAGTSGNGFDFDLGARYRILPQLTLAGSVLNLGPGIQFSTLEPLPLVVNGGVAWTALEVPDHRLTLAMDTSYQSLAATSKFSFGAEYWWKDMIALRAGYQANSPVEGISAGVGIKYSFFQIDYAFEPYNNLGAVHRFSGLFQWDGPWVGGGEPNPPSLVTVHQTNQGLEIRWSKAEGPVSSYEVLSQAGDGEPVQSPPVSGEVYVFNQFSAGTTYHFSVRSIGSGGGRSYPSKEAVFLPTSQVDLVKKMYQEQGKAAVKVSVPRGLFGTVGPVGLQLSWAPSKEKGIVGYSLYRKSSTGDMVKVSLVPKASTRVWVTHVSDLWGSEWIVTGVRRDGTERTLGSYLWYPTPQEIDELSEVSSRHLKAVPQPKRQVFLVWDGDPETESYTLLYSLAPDGVYEVFKEIKKTDTNLLMDMPGNKPAYYFIMVPRKANGGWSFATQEAKVQLYQDSPAP